MLARITVAGCEVTMLEMQYRMHPSIASFPSAEFYLGRLHTGQLDAVGAPVSFHPLAVHPVSLVHCDGREQVSGTSRANAEEAKCVARLVGLFLAQGFDWWDVGVISPYSAQVKAIQSELWKGPGNGAYVADGVSTVDAYQGQERRVIVISMVRANRGGRVGFLEEWRRTNVALTRAKEQCVVVASLPTLLLAESTALWRHWAEHYFGSSASAVADPDGAVDVAEAAAPEGAAKVGANLLQWDGASLGALDGTSEAALCLEEIVPGVIKRMASRRPTRTWTVRQCSGTGDTKPVVVMGRAGSWRPTLNRGVYPCVANSDLSSRQVSMCADSERAENE